MPLRDISPFSSSRLLRQPRSQTRRAADDRYRRTTLYAFPGAFRAEWQHYGAAPASAADDAYRAHALARLHVRDLIRRPPPKPGQPVSQSSRYFMRRGKRFKIAFTTRSL